MKRFLILAAMVIAPMSAQASLSDVSAQLGADTAAWFMKYIDASYYDEWHGTDGRLDRNGEFGFILSGYRKVLFEPYADFGRPGIREFGFRMPLVDTRTGKDDIQGVSITPAVFHNFDAGSFGLRIDTRFYVR